MHRLTTLEYLEGCPENVNHSQVWLLSIQVVDGFGEDERMPCQQQEVLDSQNVCICMFDEAKELEVPVFKQTFMFEIAFVLN